MVSISKNKPGKSGTKKALFDCKGVFNNFVYQELFRQSEKIQCPIIVKSEFCCIDCDTTSSKLVLLNKDGTFYENFDLPKEEHVQDCVQGLKQILSAG